MEKEGRIEVPAVRLEQRGLILYQGKIKARELLELWDVKRFKEEYLSPGATPAGYQREAEMRAKDISTYVRECQIPLVPSLLLAAKELEFEEFERGFGVLKIPKKQGVVTVIDGQHRGLGFEWIQNSIREHMRLFPTVTKGKERKLEDKAISELEELLDFELPATFIDGKTAAKVATEKIDKSILQRELRKAKLSEDDIERVFFFVINKTQKSIPPSLKDALMYLIAYSGIGGIPIIAKERWRAEGVPLVRDLHYDKDSPLYGLINLVGRKGAQQPVKLNTFVSSLEPLILKNEKFYKIGKDRQSRYLEAYWRVIREMFPYAFREDRIREYLVLRSLTVYALNRLANDVFNWCQEDGVEVPSENDIRKYLGPLRDFDWSKGKSPIAGFGGQKGVDEAYKKLLEELRKGGIEKAKSILEPLQSLVGR